MIENKNDIFALANKQLVIEILHQKWPIKPNHPAQIYSTYEMSEIFILKSAKSRNRFKYSDQTIPRETELSYIVLPFQVIFKSVSKVITY